MRPGDRFLCRKHGGAVAAIHRIQQNEFEPNGVGTVLLEIHTQEFEWWKGLSLGLLGAGPMLGDELESIPLQEPTPLPGYTMPTVSTPARPRTSTKRAERRVIL